MPFLVNLLILIAVSVGLGSLPLTGWITTWLTGQRLAQVGTGNVSVSAAFYHGGTAVGVLAVLAEALKGIGAVLLARSLFPQEPALEIFALILLVAGRYWMARGAGVTNVVWGYFVHDWRVAFFVGLVGGISFTIFREQQRGRLVVLCLLPLMTILLHPTDGLRGLMAMSLSVLIGWIYSRIPSDLDLPTEGASERSQQVFTFFRGDRALISLDAPLSAEKVGSKAATLAQLKQWGYAVLPGWVLPPGDDPAPLIERLDLTPDSPVIVRSSAIGEDSATATAAGQYDSILNVTSRAELSDAILRCQASYSRPAASQYRTQRDSAGGVHGGDGGGGMAVLVQPQISGVFSGVAFSRDPIARQGDAVVVEALPGDAARVVSGKVTPETYQVLITENITNVVDDAGQPISTELALPVEGSGDVPHAIVQQVAYLARQIEQRYHGIPQDIEWSYDGQQIWVLQARPITTLLPIWTRRIAAEVIPGYIRPLTWSINRPLTCGVWGELFTLVLGDRARNLDFMQTATLHHSAAYFNASLLGEIFRRMGLPAESLEFLTQGAKFTRPPLGATLRAVPGLLRLLGREWLLREDFEQDYEQRFEPQLQAWKDQPLEQCPDLAVLERINGILETLNRVTYYNILAPLSAALRQAVLRVKDDEVDQSVVPEVAALRSLQQLAVNCRHLLPKIDADHCSTPVVFTTIAEDPNGAAILRQLDQFIAEYGYLSEVATDIAVPRWADDPRPVRDLFARFVCSLPEDEVPRADVPVKDPSPGLQQSWLSQRVQSRLNLKAKVAAVYNQFLAELRWSVLALEQRWRDRSLLEQEGDIFFLTLDELKQLVTQPEAPSVSQLPAQIEGRRSQWQADQTSASPAQLVYGNDPPKLSSVNVVKWSEQGLTTLYGIGASPGQAVGRVQVLKTLTSPVQVNRETILVVPYTDAGWAPVLAQAGGIVAQVGGRLSHGAIIAREYQIPAVMNVSNALEQLKDGQRIQIDGQQGTVVIV
ncbi:MAG: glycerol-3-phosphate acyltransferase [Elainellaceae cyanobacterium]